jgi:hypothetical protein
MSYDDKGRYYFDPNNPEDLAEYEMSYGKMKHFAAFDAGQQVAGVKQQILNQSWTETLKETGLSQQQFDQLLIRDPAAAQKVIRKNMTNVAEAVKSLSQQQPAAQPGAPPQQAVRVGPNQRIIEGQVAPSDPAQRQQNLQAIREVHEKRDTVGTTDEMEDRLKALLPDSDPFFVNQ